MTLTGAAVPSLCRIGLGQWNVEATVGETRYPRVENSKGHSRKRRSSRSTGGWDVAVVWVDGLGFTARGTEHARAWRALFAPRRTSGLVPAALVARLTFAVPGAFFVDGGFAIFDYVSATSCKCVTITS